MSYKPLHNLLLDAAHEAERKSKRAPFPTARRLTALSADLRDKANDLLAYDLGSARERQSGLVAAALALFLCLAPAVASAQAEGAPGFLMSTGCVRTFVPGDSVGVSVPTTVLRDLSITDSLTLAELDAHEAVHRKQLSQPGKTCEEWLFYANSSPETLLSFEAPAYAAQVDFARAHGYTEQDIEKFWLKIAHGYWMFFEGKVPYLTIVRALGGAAFADSVEQNLRGAGPS